MAKFIDHLIHMSTLFYYRLLQMRLHCIVISDKVANFGTNTHKPELYLLLVARNSILNS